MGSRSTGTADPRRANSAASSGRAATAGTASPRQTPRARDLLDSTTDIVRFYGDLVDALPFVRRSCAVGIEPAGRTQGELPFLFVEVGGERGASPAELARREKLKREG